MFFAALISRSCRVPQDGHVQCRVDRLSEASRRPHAEQVLDDGYQRSTVTRCRPAIAALYSSIWRKVPQPQSDLSQRVRSTMPASIEVEIEGWRYAIEPADEPADLVGKFLGWADEELATARTQASRRRMGIGRPSARLEQVESTWEERKHRGQEAVYQATFQANRYFQKWNKELDAAGRCVSLLRTQAAGAWSDAQGPDAVPGPPGAAMELPDWDPRPPGA